MRRYISGDPNYTEKIGTGRFISVYEKGNHKWQEMFHHFLSSDLQMLMITIYAITRMFFIGFEYGLGLLLIIFLFSIVAYCVNTYYVVPSRKKRTETEIELTHRTVRLFMSKNEFLQTNAFVGEFKNIAKLL